METGVRILVITIFVIIFIFVIIVIDVIFILNVIYISLSGIYLRKLLNIVIKIVLKVRTKSPLVRVRVRLPGTAMSGSMS